MTGYRWIATFLVPDLFKNEDELRALWSAPSTRAKLLKQLEDPGVGELEESKL